MFRSSAWTVPALFVCAMAAHAQGGKYTLKAADTAPPKELQESIRKALNDRSLQVLDDKGNLVYEIWLRKEIPAKATAAQNDQKSESIAALMDREGIKTVFALVPNYQSGRDYMSGFERAFKGKIVDRLFYKFGESDYQAELSKVRAAKPEAVYLFAPGAMGISFMKQWTASGLGKDIKLRTIDTVDETTLKAIGDAALGDIHTAHWSPDIPHERAAKFAKSYIAKFGDYPSVLSATNYDAVTLIVRAMTALGGSFVMDGFARFMKVLTLIGSGAAILLSIGFLRAPHRRLYEFPILILLSTVSRNSDWVKHEVGLADGMDKWTTLLLLHVTLG